MAQHAAAAGGGGDRLGQILAPDYLAGIASASPEQLRAKRDACRHEEAAVSYTRRLLQARLDIARAERDRRSHGGGSLVDRMSAILADAPAATPLGNVRSAPVQDPPEVALGALVDDTLLADDSIARLPDLADAELDDLVDRLAAAEREVSRVRRQLLDRLDALSEELVARYRDGAASIDEAVSAAIGAVPDEDR